MPKRRKHHVDPNTAALNLCCSNRAADIMLSRYVLAVVVRVVKIAIDASEIAGPAVHMFVFAGFLVHYKTSFLDQLIEGHFRVFKSTVQRRTSYALFSSFTKLNLPAPFGFQDLRSCDPTTRVGI
jgi:hypothetical protein